MLRNKRPTFCLDDYNCIGFDLDNTICRYNLGTVFPLIYNGLVKYLVEEKGYDKELLKHSFEEGKDFLQKGLVLDLQRGNFLKLAKTGQIVKATHGTRRLKLKEIEDIYGIERIWDAALTCRSSILCHRTECHSARLEKVMRTFKDYFDIPAEILSAYIIDLIDKKEKEPSYYDFWPDMLDAILNLYNINAFDENSGLYFPVIKEDVSKYIYTCSPELKTWLKRLKTKNRIIYLITGSHIDYSSFLLDHCLGKDWKDYFDVYITFARKPGFFRGDRPFYRVDGMVETEEVVTASMMKENSNYSQGSWEELCKFFQKSLGAHPKALYIGDNLVQDVFAPNVFSSCDAVGVVEEIMAEGMHGSSLTHPEKDLIASSQWGSFFHDDVGEVESAGHGFWKINTYWADILQRYSRVAIPSLDVLTTFPISHRHSAFVGDDVRGFIPGVPEPLVQNA